MEQDGHPMEEIKKNNVQETLTSPQGTVSQPMMETPKESEGTKVVEGRVLEFKNTAKIIAQDLSRHKQKIQRGARITLLGAILSVAALVGATALDSWFVDQPEPLQVTRSEASSTAEFTSPDWHRNITHIAPPKQSTIFGERVPLENWEIRERFEREFYYNYQNADQILLWYKRSQRWFPYIDKALKDAGLPLDLKYLAIAESGLRNVKSSANANGFWQFIPATATRFGLRVDDNIDERLDPEKSTQAAIKYFKSMKADIPTWTLVAAAYNMGESGIEQVLEYQKQDSYWNIYVNEETMRYVFRIAAIKELIDNSERYGLELSKVQPYRMPRVKSVTVQGPVTSLADWAISQGFTYKDVKTLNPWILSRGLPSGSYRIDLPATDEDRTTVPE